MGNKNSTIGSLHTQAKLAAAKFDKDELHILEQTWQDLADRSESKGIDKETFLQYFPLNGLMGERLFFCFDMDKNGLITFDAFLMALATLARGSIDARIHFLFNMCDVSHDSMVSREELETLLNQVPTDVMHGHREPSAMGIEPPKLSRATSATSASGESQNSGDDAGGVAGASINSSMQCAINRSRSDSGASSGSESVASYSSSGSDSEGGDDVDVAEEVYQYTNHDIVEKCFVDCDINHCGKLNYEQFKMWVTRTPQIMAYIESILPFTGIKDSSPHHDKAETLPLMHRRMSMRKTNSVNNLSQEADNERGTMSSKGGSGSLKIAPSQSSKGHSHAFLKGAVDAGPPPSPSTKLRSKTITALNTAPELVRARSGTQNNNALPSPSAGSEGGMIRLQNTKYDVNGSNTFNVTTGDGEDDDEGYSSPEGRIAELKLSGSESPEVVRHLAAALDAATDPALQLAIQELVDYIENGGNNGDDENDNEDNVEDTGDWQRNDDRNSLDEAYREVVSLEGSLWKKGGQWGMWSQRYYVLSGNCMYYYGKEKDVRPKGVIFLTGTSVEVMRGDASNELKGYYGFECVHMNIADEAHRHDRRVFYCKTETERERWIQALREAAHVVPITDEYVIGKELGRGRFSVVHECVHKITGDHAAVKIINKNTVKADEKVLLRTEIAVLKLMEHPHIIQMQHLYESRDTIYIVMEKLSGGELFERIVGRPRFTEQEAAKLLRPLLESIAYMHDLGIVHRDIKPENILCGEDLSDLKIADFGLSKMILPSEKMTQPCGTLSYVAPEVLTNQGYGKEADLWSVGVIMFLLICGKLPFDGNSADEIIKSTVQGDLKVNPSIWGKLTDPARSLLRSLLTKNDTDRITARQALKHEFLTVNAPVHHKKHHHHHHHHHHRHHKEKEAKKVDKAGRKSPDTESAPVPA